MTAHPLPAPDRLTPSQRAIEITRMLANAVRRMQTEFNQEKEPVGLGFTDQRSVHTPPYPTEKTA